MFQAGTMPVCMSEGLVTPVFKEGDPFDTANNKPVAVTDPLMILYAVILNARLQNYIEQTHLKADTQTGFRPHLSTEHQLFALQTFIDSSNAADKPLFCCFLDLKGAYDKVQRPLLWQVLQRLGVTGRMLAALQSMYETASIRVHVQGRAGWCHLIPDSGKGALLAIHCLAFLPMDCIVTCLLSALTRGMSLATGAVCLTLVMLMTLSCLLTHHKACRGL